MNPFSGVRAISFDVGGTLIDPWPSVGHVYAAVARETGRLNFDPARLTARFAAAWRAKAGFDYSPEAWAALVARTFGDSSAEWSVDSERFRRLYERFTEAGAWKVRDDVVPTLQTLAARGFKLAAISNWDNRLRPLLRNLRLDQFFHTIVISAECACQKPDPALFRRATADLQMAPEQVLHVGDSLVEDVRGAQSAGLQAVLLRRGSARPVPSCGQIRSLSELPGLVEEPIG